MGLKIQTLRIDDTPTMGKTCSGLLRLVKAVSCPYELRRLFAHATNPQWYGKLQGRRAIETDTGYSLKPFVDRRCIFVHIPKCAGVSICKSLFGNLAGGHLKIADYMRAFNKREFESYFKFTFVRNPWDRVVSAFHFLKEGGMTEADRCWSEQHLSSFHDFDDFVRRWLNRKNIQSMKHFVPQYQFVCRPGGTSPEVDFIGLYENLTKDFSYIKGKLGARADLREENRTKCRKSDYKEYYTEATRRLVGDIYQEDVQMFGYTFDNSSLKKQLAGRSN